jgi:hypothetical protein
MAFEGPLGLDEQLEHLAKLGAVSASSGARA